QQDELIAANACQQVTAAQLLIEPCGDLHENLVAHLVTQGVVDGLELVQVDEHHCQLGGGITRLVERAAEPLVEGGAVEQPGKGVMGGLVGELVLLFLVFGDVAHDADEMGQGAALVDHW
ncbi:hypothetical protein AOR10_24435, partial [Vibrio alginolyticus]